MIDLKNARRRINGFIADVSAWIPITLEVKAVFAHDKTRQRTSAAAVTVIVVSR